MATPEEKAAAGAPTGAPGRHPLDPVLRPRSVAVVGASADPRKRGFQVLRALREAGYGGRVLPVNPRGGEILGLPVYASLDALPERPDLALVCTPAASVPEVLERCGARGIPGAVVLAVGFRESGEAGEALEARVAEVARRVRTRVVGPNTSGILNLSLGLNLIGVREVRPGSLGLLVQSGNLALALLLEAGSRSAQGVSVCVGVGNETDVAFHEYLEFLGADAETRAVLVHAEGFREARAFLETAARVGREKPVVLLKGGRSLAGQVTARSHTGALAGEYPVLRAGLAQAGVVEVTRADELFHVGETLAAQPPLAPGSGVAVLADGGGQATLATDALGEMEVPLASLDTGTRTRLRELLGPAAAVGNPVDLAGRSDADPEVFARALEVLVLDPAVGAVLVVGLFGGYALRFAADLEEAETEAAAGMALAAARAGKPLVVHSMYASARSGPLLRLTEAGVPVVESLEVACRCLEAAARRGRFLAEPPWEGAAGERGVARAVPAATDLMAAARAAGRASLTEPEGRRLLGAYGVAFPPATLCVSPEEAARAARAAEAPVAMKAVSRGILHKTEAGGVVLDVAGPAEAARAFVEIQEGALAYLSARGSREPLDGVLVVPMLYAPLAELFVGVRRDSQVGPVLTVGAGGVGVEVFRDVSLAVLPASRGSLARMVRELRIAPLLLGARGRPAADLDSVCRVMEGVAACVWAHPEIRTAEVNPVFAYPDGALAVDARVVLGGSDAGDDGAPP